MSETLVIGGQTFENVAGFKVQDSSASTQIYIKPSGAKEVSITSNGTLVEDVSAYASAQISVAVPNTYAAADEGKVVSSGELVAQGSASYSSNGTYDTTLVSWVEVDTPQAAGSTTVTDIGTYDVSAYASVVVNIPLASGVSF